MSVKKTTCGSIKIGSKNVTIVSVLYVSMRIHSQNKLTFFSSAICSNDSEILRFALETLCTVMSTELTEDGK